MADTTWSDFMVETTQLTGELFVYVDPDDHSLFVLPSAESIHAIFRQARDLERAAKALRDRARQAGDNEESKRLLAEAQEISTQWQDRHEYAEEIERQVRDLKSSPYTRCRPYTLKMPALGRRELAERAATTVNEKTGAQQVDSGKVGRILIKECIEGLDAKEVENLHPVIQGELIQRLLAALYPGAGKLDFLASK